MFSFVGILIPGFFLGLRQCHRSDHVVAVMTIVSRPRGIAKASAIGALWGVGHTFTIFLVGAAIILFNVVIPPRLGLSMEFAVGLMLILLGVLNLTGVLQWMQRRFAPSTRLRKLLCRCLAIRRPLQRLSRRLGNGWTGAFVNWGFTTSCGLSSSVPFIGLAGSAAVAILVMAAIPDPWFATAWSSVVRFGYHRRDDGDDHRDGFPHSVSWPQNVSLESRDDIWFRRNKCRVRNVYISSDRHSRRPFRRQPALDAALTHRTQCRQETQV